LFGRFLVSLKSYLEGVWCSYVDSVGVSGEIAQVYGPL